MSNDLAAKANPAGIQEDLLCADDDEARFTRLVRLKIFGKSPLNAYMQLNRNLWRKLPKSVTALYPVRRYGDFLHALAGMQGFRAQLLHTFFLRNRPMLELIRRLVKRSNRTDVLRVAVLGCSTGAEAYSVAMTIRSARPDLKLILHGVDISEQALKIAEAGVYSLVGSQFAESNLFDCVTEADIEELFDRQGDLVAIKSWIKEGMRWLVGDVRQSGIVTSLGSQDIVVANNFLCHMNASVAGRCLRNIAHLVTPQGYLFVSGVDLDIRTKVAKELGWHPLQELLEEIHDGDPRMGSSWPFNYSSLEPLNKRRHDWRLRYATAFQLGSCAKSSLA
jgi:chemotaxis methyl-accepting protein methylase